MLARDMDGTIGGKACTRHAWPHNFMAGASAIFMAGASAIVSHIIRLIIIIRSHLLHGCDTVLALLKRDFRHRFLQESQGCYAAVGGA